MPWFHILIAYLWIGSLLRCLRYRDQWTLLPMHWTGSFTFHPRFWDVRYSAGDRFSQLESITYHGGRRIYPGEAGYPP